MTSQFSTASGAQGPPGDDWLKGEREHERQMRELELAEKKHADAYRQWRYERRAVAVAFAVVIIAVVGVIGYGMYLWAQHTGELSRQDNDQRIACLEQGGTPTNTDTASGDSWLCLYLEKEQR